MAQEHERLEREWGSWVGAHDLSDRNCQTVACSSGTAALHLALEALRLPQGSAVIVPDLTMVACARAVTLAGLRPVFVDCGEDLCMDFGSMVRALEHEPDVKAVMPVHIYGRSVDMHTLHNLLSAYDVYVIEDLAEAHGIKPHARSAAACWSFYKNKVVHGEEGGAVWFRDPSHSDVARSLRSLGFTQDHDFMHYARGHNYRMSNTHAQLILDNLVHGHELIRQRRRLELIYQRYCPAEWLMPARHVVWVYDLRLRTFGCVQNDAVRKLKSELNVEARHCFKPMHIQPEYYRCSVYHRDPSSGSNASVMSREVIYLPCDPQRPVTDQKAEQVFSLLKDLCR